MVDFDMPFVSMVGLMMKWALAAIPAVIMLAFLGALIGGMFATLAGLTTLLGR